MSNDDGKKLRETILQKCPTPYNFLYIFQMTCAIILKFSVSNFLSVLVKKIINLKIFSPKLH